MRIAILLLSCLLAVGCAARGPADAGATFVVVRHAEKAAGDWRDPPLSADGERRAEALAGVLRAEKLVAVYATGYQRTQLTARPGADAHGLDVTVYDAARPAADFAASLRRAHAGGTVLVVGHSNTVPDIASALCGCPVAPIGDGDFGDLYRIRTDGQGRSVLEQGRY